MVSRSSKHTPVWQISSRFCGSRLSDPSTCIGMAIRTNATPNNKSKEHIWHTNPCKWTQIDSRNLWVFVEWSIHFEGHRQHLPTQGVWDLHQQHQCCLSSAPPSSSTTALLSHASQFLLHVVTVVIGYHYPTTTFIMLTVNTSILRRLPTIVGHSWWSTNNSQQ